MAQLRLGKYQPEAMGNSPMRPPDAAADSDVDHAIDLVSSAVSGLFNHLGLDASNARSIKVKPRLIFNAEQVMSVMYFVTLSDYEDDDSREYNLRAEACKDHNGGYAVFEPFEGSGMEENIVVTLGPEMLAYERSIAYFAMYQTMQSN